MLKLLPQNQSIGCIERAASHSIPPTAGMELAFGDIERTYSSFDAISQFLDTRCLAAKKGSLYEIKVWVKLLNPSTGETFHCDMNLEKCLKWELSRVLLLM